MKSLSSSSKMFLGIGAVVVVLLFGFQLLNGTSANEEVADTNTVELGHMTVYKSPNCGCCGNYVAYLRRMGFDVDIVETDDMDAIKDTHNIPANMQSCHTTVLDDLGFVVEGHVPVEAIQALTVSSDGFQTIAMPGMPSGSPGMPGPKRDYFSVYGISSDGTVSSFLEL